MPRLIELKETIHSENREEKVHYVTVYALVQNKDYDTTKPYEMNKLLSFVIGKLEEKGYSLASLTVTGNLRIRPLWRPRIEPHFDRPDILIFRFSSLQRPTSMDPAIPTMEDFLFSQFFPQGT